MGLNLQSVVFILSLISSISHAAPREAKLPSEFDAQVIRVVDGDTFKFKASLLDVDISGTCRMSEYNAPEIHGIEKPEGEKAKAEMIRLIGGKKVHMATRGKDKYGRWLCTASSGTVSIGKMMLAFLKDYPGRDKYRGKHTRHVSTNP